MHIEPLARHPGLAPVLARWHHDEWAGLYRGWDLATAERELVEMRTDAIPVTWVAFDGDGRGVADVLGSVSLIDDDDLESHRHLRPWLASLFVVPAARGRGVGAALVRHTVAQARAMGEARLHLFTAGQERFYAGLGWRVVDRVRAHGEPVAVMAISTDPRGARRALATRWCTDPDIATAYSYLRPGGTPADRRLLAAPVRRGLHLAGEATSHEHPGTMHGAWFSGQRAARAVLAEWDHAAPPRVVVVGAGLAGIAAARELTEHGAVSEVLEASARIGGRARSDASLGGPANLGGMWAHGDIGNPIAEAARELGLAFASNVWRHTTTFVAGVGRLSDGDDARLGALAGGVEAALDAAAAAGDEQASVGSALRPLLAALPAGDRLVVQAWELAEFENLYAAPVDDLSLVHRAEPFALPGDDLLVLGSMDDVVARLAEGVAIETGVGVEAIEADGDEWRIVTSVGVRGADAIVVTVPVGALQAGRIRFDPPLPAPVVEALGRLGAGRVAKVFATFDEPFWAPHRTFFVAADPPAPLATWVDVTDVVGRPALCAFATGDVAVEIERRSEDGLCALVDEVLASAGLTALGGA